MSVIYKVRIQSLTQPAFLEIDWGQTPNYNSDNTIPTLINPVADTTIFVTVNGLIANTSYSYQAQLLGGASAFSPVGTFVTGCTVFTTVINPTSSQICSGGNEVLTIANPVVGYTYTWSPAGSLNSPNGITVTASPTISTTYTVNGTNGGSCTTSATTMVSVNSLPSIFVSNPITICRGDSTQLNSSSSGGISYSWSPTLGLSNANIHNPIAHPTLTTIYVVTVANSNGCTRSDSVTITVTQEISLNIAVNGDTTFCKGGSTQLIALVDGETTYHWSPSIGLSNAGVVNPVASPSATTTYTFTASNAGCTKSKTVGLTVYRLKLTSYSLTGMTFDVHGDFPTHGLDSMRIWGSNNPVVYGWDNSIQYSDQYYTSFYGVLLNNGDHIKLVSSFGCDTAFIYSNVGISEVNLIDAKFGPNPFSKTLNVQVPKVHGQYKVLLINAIGQVVREFFTEGDFSIERNNLSDGMYVLNIISPENKIILSQKVEIK